MDVSATGTRRMPSLAVFAVALVLGCEDLPTAPDVAGTPPGVGLSTDVLAAMHALLDDPLVQDVIVQADHTRTVQHTMQDVMDRLAAGEPHAIRRALTEAQRTLQQSSDDDAVVPRAALGLTLGAVKTVLDSATNAAAATGDALPFALRGGHHD